MSFFSELPYAHGGPISKGLLKQNPQDFCVTEKLSFEPSGEGEHWLVLIQKSMLTTEEMVQIIAKKLSIKPSLISYAGLKDKFGITTQWFSIHLPGKTALNLEDLNGSNFKALKAVRNLKKLKIGALAENHFKIRAQGFSPDTEKLRQKISVISKAGVPNYFGPQRFGHQESNLIRAKALLLEGKPIKSRYLKGLYYSAARAYLFNAMVASRVKGQSWNRPLPGDVMMLSGTQSYFLEKGEAGLEQRVENHDISPAVPLWGHGKDIPTKEARKIQDSVLQNFEDWCQALEAQGLRKAFRPMVLVPKDFCFEEGQFQFGLPKGSYATSLLREIIQDNG